MNSNTDHRCRNQTPLDNITTSHTEGNSCLGTKQNLWYIMILESSLVLSLIDYPEGLVATDPRDPWPLQPHSLWPGHLCQVTFYVSCLKLVELGGKTENDHREGNIPVWGFSTGAADLFLLSCSAKSVPTNTSRGTWSHWKWISVGFPRVWFSALYILYLVSAALIDF